MPWRACFKPLEMLWSQVEGNQKGSNSTHHRACGLLHPRKSLAPYEAMSVGTPSYRLGPLPHPNSATKPNLTIILLTNPPETGISGVFLGIRVSSRPILTPVSSRWRYIHTNNPKIDR